MIRAIAKSAMTGAVVILAGAAAAQEAVPPVGADCADRDAVSQHGITWQFDRSAATGRFVTGDWWVVGPVTVVSVTPAPGKPAGPEDYGIKANQFGDTAMQQDDRMRNGSMLVLKAGGEQGYDSRQRNYRPELSVSFPCALEPNQSLVSTISNPKLPAPTLVGRHLWASEQKGNYVLRTAAVLTCLPAAPPADAFRPSYAGTEKTLYRAQDLKRDLLPKLPPPSGMPAPDEIIRFFDRPWLDHQPTWLATYPGENNPGYGREYSRVVGWGGCMLLLDIPPDKKEKLLIHFIQLGIDLHGLTKVGMKWSADGGIWSGRKFPILCAGLMLGDQQMLNPPDSVLFHEDQQTYYGQSFWGHTVLWQMVSHHGPRTPFEEKNPKDYDAMDKRSDGYRVCCNGHSWLGIALAARWLKLMAAWNHDAFFDYCDRWMDPREKAIDLKRPARNAWSNQATHSDAWITALWQAHRAAAPAQDGARENRKWVWEGNQGKWVPNPRPAQVPFAE